MGDIATNITKKELCDILLSISINVGDTTKKESILSFEDLLKLLNVKSSYISTEKKTAVVELQDGKRGKCSCSSEDTFDPFVGFCLAYVSAITQNKKTLKQVITNKFKYSLDKGHKHCIIH
jgi:predicted transposase YbfD/YdcC